MKRIRMKLILSNGSTRYGAQMGMANVLPVDTHAPGKLHLTRLRWRDGDYDEAGAYWGGGIGDHIYCAWGDLAEVDCRVFVRAATRLGAKTQVQDILPNVTFFH